MKPVKIPVRALCLSAAFAAVTAVCAQISIPLPFTPAPISCAMVGLYTAAILLPPQSAVLSQLVYLLLGGAGLPVFAGFRGGPGALFGPTGGYLLVYPLMAAIVSMSLNGVYDSRRALLRGTGGIITAHLLLYTGGTLWLAAMTGAALPAVLRLAVFPFIPLDIVKIAFCVLAVIPLRRRFMQAGLLLPGRARTAPLNPKL